MNGNLKKEKMKSKEENINTILEIAGAKEPPPQVIKVSYCDGDCETCESRYKQGHICIPYEDPNKKK